MYNLAIFNLSDYSIPTEVKLYDFCFSDENQLLSQLETIHGVLIHCPADENENKVLELILSIKRRRFLPIWVRTEANNVKNRKLNLELGVLDNFDGGTIDEEMFVIIENTLNIVYNKENVNRKKSNDIFLNSSSLSIKIPGKTEVRLTRMEFKMMSLFVRHLSQVLTYEEIYKHIWEKKDTLDSAAKRSRIANVTLHIRNKLAQHGINPEVLKTVRSVGYVFELGSEKDLEQENRLK